MFGSLLVINYLQIINKIIFSMVFMQREKLFKCLVSFQFLHKHQKNKSIVNLYQKQLLGCFSEEIKMWPSHNLLNW